MNINPDEFTPIRSHQSQFSSNPSLRYASTCQFSASAVQAINESDYINVLINHDKSRILFRPCDKDEDGAYKLNNHRTLNSDPLRRLLSDRGLIRQRLELIETEHGLVLDLSQEESCTSQNNTNL